VGVGHDELDVTDPESVANIPAGRFGGIDWCVNCAAYTVVDKAETEEEAAMAVNGYGVGYLAGAARLAGARLLHISTDFVFDGSATEPYEPDAPTNPLGVYGRSKLAGEKAALANDPGAVVVRTAWLYGPQGKSFPRTMIQAHAAGKSLRVVADQVGTPTCTLDLAVVLANVIEANIAPGTYHAAGPETMSWHEFAERAIKVGLTEAGKPAEVSIEPIGTEDWPTPAVRPKFSALSFRRLAEAGIAPMRSVDESLTDFVRRLPA